MAEALLIVDVQKGFVGRSSVDIPAIVTRLQGDYDIVYATRFVNPPGSFYRQLMHWSRFAPGTEECELAFTPASHVRLIEKHKYSCVTPEFVAELRVRNVDIVRVCGIDTDICVMKCAVDLLEAGFRPIVLADACASHAGAEYHRMALKILRRYLGAEQIEGG